MQMSAVAAPRLRSISESAIELGVSRDTVRRLVRKGKIRGVRVGRRLLVPQVELDRLIASGCRV